MVVEKAAPYGAARDIIILTKKESLRKETGLPSLTPELRPRQTLGLRRWAIHPERFGGASFNRSTDACD